MSRHSRRWGSRARFSRSCRSARGSTPRGRFWRRVRAARAFSWARASSRLRSLWDLLQRCRGLGLPRLGIALLPAPAFACRDTHRFPPLFAQHLGQHLAVLDVPGEQDLVRQGPPLDIVLLEEIPQEIAPGRDFPKVIFLAAGDQAGPHQEDQHHRLLPFLGDAHHVLVPGSGAGHGLALQGGLNGLDAVAQLRGLLKIKVGRGLIHFQL